MRDRTDLRHLLALLLTVVLFVQCRSEDQQANAKSTVWHEVGRHHLAVPEPSSLLWDAGRGWFWTVSDQTGRIYALSKRGVLLDSLTWEGVDLEAITIDPTDSTFYVVEEQPGVIDHLDTDGRLLNSFSVEGMDLASNHGLEGIAWSADGQRLFAVREQEPGTLLELNRDGEVLLDQRLRFAPDYSDLACPGGGDTLLVLSDQGECLASILTDGTVLELETLPDISNPEGFAIVEDTLYVVSDANRNLVLYVRE